MVGKSGFTKEVLYIREKGSCASLLDGRRGARREAGLLRPMGKSDSHDLQQVKLVMLRKGRVKKRGS